MSRGPNLLKIINILLGGRGQLLAAVCVCVHVCVSVCVYMCARICGGGLISFLFVF